MADANVLLLQSEDLLQHLEQHCAAQAGLSGSSHVTAVRIVREQATNASKGIAFVQFTTKAAMRAALSADGQPFQKRPLRILRVKPAAGASTGSQPGKGPSKAGKPSSKEDNVRAAERRLKRRGRGEAAPSWQGTRTKGPGKVRVPLAESC